MGNTQHLNFLTYIAGCLITKRKKIKNSSLSMKMKTFSGQLVARFGIRRVDTHWGHLCLRQASLLFAQKSTGASSPCQSYNIPCPRAPQNPLHGL